VKVKIISVGKIKEKYIQLGIEEFSKRLTPHVKLELIEVKDFKAPQNYSDAEIEKVKEQEGTLILSHVQRDDYLVALAIDANQKSSEAFASHLDQLMTYGHSKVCFVIGGSNGLSNEVYSRSNELLSFSKMTFPHQLMKLVLLEQLFRAIKILKNEPYHK